jgi:hypothetical protein
LNTPLWHNGLVVVILVTKSPLLNRNITLTGVPNIFFQNTNDVIIHHEPIKPITPNEIITTTDMFVDYLSQCFTNKIFIDVSIHEVPVKTIKMGFYCSGAIGTTGFKSRFWCGARLIGSKSNTLNLILRLFFVPFFTYNELVT